MITDNYDVIGDNALLEMQFDEAAKQLAVSCAGISRLQT
jgi:hypothetical protein